MNAYALLLLLAVAVEHGNLDQRFFNMPAAPSLQTLRLADADSTFPGEPIGYNGASDSSTKDDGRYLIWRENVVWLGLGILTFSAVLFVLQFVIMFKSGDYWTDQSFKAFSLTLIITSAIFLIVVGWTDDQLSPIMGLLGTIAGYILGEQRGRSNAAAESSELGDKQQSKS